MLLNLKSFASKIIDLLFFEKISDKCDFPEYFSPQRFTIFFSHLGQDSNRLNAKKLHSEIKKLIIESYLMDHLQDF